MLSIFAPVGKSLITKSRVSLPESLSFVCVEEPSTTSARLNPPESSLSEYVGLNESVGLWATLPPPKPAPPAAGSVMPFIMAVSVARPLSSE